MPPGLFVALLLFQTWAGEKAQSYTEELHLLHAESLENAQAQAGACGQAQDCDYHNAAGEVVSYRFLRVVDVQPALFPAEQRAVYTRSFGDLPA